MATTVEATRPLTKNRNRRWTKDPVVQMATGRASERSWTRVPDLQSSQAVSDRDVGSNGRRLMMSYGGPVLTLCARLQLTMAAMKMPRIRCSARC